MEKKDKTDYDYPFLYIHMEFFLFFVISIFFLKSVKKYSKLTLTSASIICMPFILFWCLICGGQYFIGTDYLSYLTFFQGKDLDKMQNDGEFGLPWFVNLCNTFYFEGQDLFFILSFLWCILFLFFCLELANVKYLYLYFFFFVASTNFFNNQLNGIRQATAAYLCNTAILLFINRKHLDFRIKHLLFDKYVLLSSFFMFMSIMWHRSAFFMLFWVPFLKEYRLFKNRRIYYVFIVGCIAGTYLISDELIMSLVGGIDIYAHYLNSEYMYQKMSIQNIVVRYLNLIPFLLCIHRLPHYNLSSKYLIYFFLGIVGEGIVLLSITNSVIYRFAAYFHFVSIYPLIVFMDYLLKKNKIILYRAIILYYFVIYSFKVLFWAQGEYRFDSIFYH